MHSQPASALFFGWKVEGGRWKADFETPGSDPIVSFCDFETPGSDPIVSFL